MSAAESPAAPEVEVWFDLVSPYSYLGLAAIERGAAPAGVTWRVRPVVYGVLLDRSGLVGPAEVDLKRRYTFMDIRRAAALLEVPLVGPPAHPFRSLEALRMVLALDDAALALRLATTLAAACWGAGRDLTDPDVLAAEAGRCGLDGSELLRVAGEPPVKGRLRAETERALGAGVFGVPTFALGGELFWGHDRLPHLAARLEGRIPDPRAGLEAALRRPRGADRAGRR